MFCKKCHKRIIEIVKDFHEVKNKCICNDNGCIKVTNEKTELTGTRNSNIAHKKSK